MLTENKTPLHLPIEGMDSEHCALIIDKGLKEVKGIGSHKVELNNRRAVITTDSADALPKAVKAIRDLGYGVTTVKKNFPVLQMTCASCAVSVESMLKAQTGVVNVSVNIASASATVEYIPGIIKPADMKKAVQSIGYDLVIDESADKDDTLEKLQQELDVAAQAPAGSYIACRGQPFHEACFVCALCR